MLIAASLASAGFCVPLISPCCSPPAAPKLLKITFETLRFMAFAISSVSKVPAEPTTMPAIINAGFCST